MLLFIFN